ncbi:MAG TPA: NAD(P)/FAD-dependent oxidoreductase [Armatimonadota bacterium]|nr:NAD(P)/FAD-dependent oxidoreductase [Armatimonadota bacterium]
MSQQTAIIIGAGPAGLTAAYELLDRSDVHPIVVEATRQFGGLARTEEYRGNRIDIGGHRFFSKSDRVMDWWFNIMPRQGAPAWDDRQLHRDVELTAMTSHRSLGTIQATTCPAPDPEVDDLVMLTRSRLSRILYLGKFFDYPVTLNKRTIKNLGMGRLARIGTSYITSRLFPRRQLNSLEDFFINRFGHELYATFFRDYTAKVWGVPCTEIPPQWGAQRVKGLSLWKVLLHALGSLTGIRQGQQETSLIESFVYPKFGPGQLWETVAEQVVAAGGEIRGGQTVVGIATEQGRVIGVYVEDADGKRDLIRGDYVISTMPVRELIAAFDSGVPDAVRRIAQDLRYRDFLTVGVLTRRLQLKNETDFSTINNIVPDNWIYIQEPQSKVGRLQIFNNWSPYMVADPETVWIGMEYFCSIGDEFWSMPDARIAAFAADELAAMKIAPCEDILDTTVIRAPRAYPAYFGSFQEFDAVREFTDTIPNLYLIGRNGMHRYNNMDHSMLTAMAAVDHITGLSGDKAAIWQVNAEEEYHEAK